MPETDGDEHVRPHARASGTGAARSPAKRRGHPVGGDDPYTATKTSGDLRQRRQFAPIEELDSDGDGVINLDEIVALTFPGDPADVPALPSPTPTATLLPATPTYTPSPTEQATASPAATSTATSGICVGSCNGDDMVAINELVTLVNIALEALSPSACPQGLPGGATGRRR
jgi:hypothetical protein